MHINMDRLLTDIEWYASYGKDSRGGVTRPSFSEADLEIRDVYIRELREMGLEVSIDGVANIWGKRRGTGKKAGSIVIGSHLDTVPNGGKYDGALGVLMAKEIVKTIMEHNISLDHDLEIVSFTAEESNDFYLSTMGSRAFVGRLTPDELKVACDSQGILLVDALEKAGGGMKRFHEIEELKKDKKVFIELHIEQGKRLEAKNIAVAVVDKAVGIYRSKVTVFGEANHSGTTMMAHRKDALTAAAEMILEVERLSTEDQTDLVGTVGRLNLFPNTVNTVPGQVEFVLEVRGETEEQIHQVVREIQAGWAIIGERRQVTIEQNVMLDQKPALFDSEVVSIIQNTAEELSEPYLTLASMAVHDAVHMSAIAKSAMIFVKSIDGKSHCPDEYSTPEDIERVGQIFLQAVIKMDQLLD
jgi:hydantoinase/carbamoylase family amidase